MKIYDKSFVGAIRTAIDASGVSRYQLCKNAKVDQGQLSRFMRGRGWLGPDTLNRLTDTLGLQIIASRQANIQSGSK